jgi:HTH-type transcriptional regulator, competence development regulator
MFREKPQEFDAASITASTIALRTYLSDLAVKGPLDKERRIACLGFNKQKMEEPDMSGKKFGAIVRREREAKEIGLREMAKMIGVSPTYLSKVERDEFPPPAEDRVRKIAEILDRDPDQLLALAGRVASDLTEIIRKRPREMADFLRAAKGLSADEMARLAREAQKAKDKN